MRSTEKCIKPFNMLARNKTDAGPSILLFTRMSEVKAQLEL